MRIVGEEGSRGGEQKEQEKVKETRKGAEDSLSRALPVTCTSRVCLPASRSGSYLHSADEAATVPRRLASPSPPGGLASVGGARGCTPGVVQVVGSLSLSQDRMCRRIFRSHDDRDENASPR